MRNKTDLEWCTGPENDKKLCKIRGGSRGRGVDWVANHPPLEHLTKKIYQSIIRGKTYQNTWLPKKSRKLPVTISTRLGGGTHLSIKSLFLI